MRYEVSPCSIKINNAVRIRMPTGTSEVPLRQTKLSVGECHLFTIREDILHEIKALSQNLIFSQLLFGRVAKEVKGEQVPAALSGIRLARRVRSTQCHSEGKR